MSGQLGGVMVGTILQHARQRLGLTLVAVAEEAGISFQYLSLIEHNDRTPTAQVAYRIGIAVQLSKRDMTRLLKALATDDPCERPFVLRVRSVPQDDDP